MPRSSKHDYRDAFKAADFINSKIKTLPKAAVLTGTGLGEIIATFQTDTIIDYREIPHFPTATVQSHLGRLVAGRLGDQPLLVLQGRFHLYEGHSPLEITFPVRVLQEMGIHYLILTNASGGLNPLFSVGDIMIIEDHVNLTGANPLIGPNDEKWGSRFVDMTHAYSEHLQDLAHSAAGDLEVGVQRGIYVGLTGPSLETPAEMHFLRTIGADAVGFSTVLETIAGVHAGMHVLGLSVITNMCLPDAISPADVDEIIDVARLATPHVETIIAHVMSRLDEDNE